MDMAERAARNTAQQQNHKFFTELLKEQDKLNHALLREQEISNGLLFDKQEVLTLKIHREQSKLTKIFIGATVFASISSVVIGTLLGSYIERNKSENQSKQSTEITRPQVSEKTSSRHKETNASLAQKESTSTNASSPNPTLNQTTNSVVESGHGAVKKQGD